MLAVFCIASACLLSSCSGYMAINRIDGFAEKRKAIQKIIYISPQARAFHDYDFNSLDLEKTESLQKFLNTEMNIISSKKSNKVELISIDPNQDMASDVFQSLIPLRNELLLHVQMQDNPLNKGRGNYDKTFTKQVFVVPIKISPDWSRLSKKLGTPYVGFIGAFSSPAKSVVVNYVADINKGQIIYQCITGKQGKLNNSTLSHMVFDSVLLMNKSK